MPIFLIFCFESNIFTINSSYDDIPDLSSILANIGLTGSSAIRIPRGSVNSPSSSIAIKQK